MTNAMQYPNIEILQSKLKNVSLVFMVHVYYLQNFCPRAGTTTRVISLIGRNTQTSGRAVV